MNDYYLIVNDRDEEQMYDGEAWDLADIRFIRQEAYVKFTEAWSIAKILSDYCPKTKFIVKAISSNRLEKIIEEDFEQYKEVFKSLA